VPLESAEADEQRGLHPLIPQAQCGPRFPTALICPAGMGAVEHAAQGRHGIALLADQLADVVAVG